MDAGNHGATNPRRHEFDAWHADAVPFRIRHERERRTTPRDGLLGLYHWKQRVNAWLS